MPIILPEIESHTPDLHISLDCLFLYAYDKDMKHATHTTISVPYLTIVVGSVIGGLAAFLQTIERIKWGERPDGSLVCNINDTLSCSNVFGAWQSSVFGFSNALLCLVFFTVMFGFSIAMLKSEKTSRISRLVAQFFSVFFLCFGAWYITQMIFVVGSVCIYCAACYAGVIAINWGWLRVNANDLPLPTKAVNILKNAITKGYDTFAWLLYGLLFVFLFLYRFYI